MNISVDFNLSRLKLYFVMQTTCIKMYCHTIMKTHLILDVLTLFPFNSTV